MKTYEEMYAEFNIDKEKFDNLNDLVNKIYASKNNNTPISIRTFSNDSSEQSNKEEVVYAKLV